MAPAGYLLDSFGTRVVYDSGLSLDFKLSAIIRDGTWCWPYARSDTIVEIQSRLPELMLEDADLPVWSSNNGVYSCASTWDHLRRKKPTIDWWVLVWNSLSIPQHSFFLWLVFKEAIVTKVRMCSWGYEGDRLYSLCLFCRGCQESQDHLFFLSSFSRRIWVSLMVDCSLPNLPVVWENVVQ